MEGIILGEMLYGIWFNVIKLFIVGPTWLNVTKLFAVTVTVLNKKIF